MTFLQKMLVQSMRPNRSYTFEDMRNRIHEKTGAKPEIDEIREAANALRKVRYLECLTVSSIDTWSLRNAETIHSR